MRTLTQTALPFKVEATEEMLTANAGLALFGEFAQGLGLHRWLAQEMPLPGSRRGYEAGAFVSLLVLMLAGGGCSLEDLRTLKADTALAALLKLGALPSTDAFGDLLRRTGAGAGIAGLDRINQRTVATRLRQLEITRHTLDCDASQIVAEKEAAQFTYKDTGKTFASAGTFLRIKMHKKSSGVTLLQFQSRILGSILTTNTTVLKYSIELTTRTCTCQNSISARGSSE